MHSEDFYAARDDRTVRYGERRLDPMRSIHISASQGYLQTVAGQVAAICLANLLARMSRKVSLGFADVELDLSIPLARGSLIAYLLAVMREADPFGEFQARERRDGDYILHIGREGHDWIIHGTGWNAYVGPAPSPLSEDHDDNPFGAAFAAVMAAAAIFNPQFPEAVGPQVADVLRWRAEEGANFSLVRPASLGTVWIVGAGSVGSAAAYFMALADLRFDALLLDMDIVKIHNLDRSPVFTFADLGKPKVEAVQRFLKSAGIEAEVEPTTLRASTHWKGRQAGTPDILVAAANEDNVRYDIEQGYPPVQIFGTTGKSWQSAIFTLFPSLDPCTCCIFPPDKPADTSCASDGPGPDSDAAEPDAALPFLSFAAGLMTAIEVAKLSLPGEGFSENRSFFQPKGGEVVMTLASGRRRGCVCSGRHADVHKAMLAGSRYANRSKF